MKKLYLILLLLSLMALNSIANDGSFQASGGQLVPVKETDISVKKEILRLRRNGRRMMVDVYYEFYNPTSDYKKLIVGFETPPPSGDFYVPEGRDIYKEQPSIYNFSVRVNGQKLMYEVALYPYNSTYALSPEQILQMKRRDERGEGSDEIEFEYVYYFNAVFKPGMNIVRHTYQYDVSGSVDTEFEFPYDLTPACRWANGQIDDFTLIIDMGAPESFLISQRFFNSSDTWTIHGEGNQFYDAQYKAKGFNVRSGYVEFKKKNFKPAGELFIFKKRKIENEYY